MTFRALVIGSAHDSVATDRSLSSRGWQVARIEDVTTASAWLRTTSVDVIVLDTEVAADVGLVRRVRRVTTTPVVALVRNTSEEHHVAVLEAGAEAVLPFPYGGALIHAQASALSRRRREAIRAREAVEVGGIRLDPQTREVHVNGAPVRLTRIEFDLLSLLMTDPSRVLGRSQILGAVWGDWYGQDHLVEVHLSRMRTKIVRAGGPRVGHAIPGVGYRLLGGEAGAPAPAPA